ncbi:cytochrome c551 [Bacillus sp. 165]|uniref:cytochrome c551 n=1 Tax=Bacillus sp. 165 TaxID=1529117 RepID=UPI001ADBD614|nr:cytochrome c [Bacillus sp. 165]MBO9129943.1 cytochrome c [Bacillus sp. 165]
MRKKILVSLMGAALALTMAACGKSEETPSETNQTANGGTAEKIFQQSCSSCHGSDLAGRVGPSLQHVGQKYSQDEISGIISKGRGSMPGGLLQGEDAEKVASWLAEKK